ncbi:MAG: hypothetical protein ACI9P8_000704 [Bacteroidia bacterium]|jgi:hypothetical protein
MYPFEQLSRTEFVILTIAKASDRAMLKTLWFTLIFLISVHLTVAQEMLGIANSNFAGTNGVALNPASMVDSKVWLDVNIVGVDVYFNNNFAYYSKEDFYFWENVPSGNMPDIRRKDDRKNRRAQVQVKAMGPAFTLALGKHAIGVHTGARVFVSAEGVPQPFAVSMFEGLRYEPQLGIDYSHDQFRVNALGFAEIGLSYATIISSHRENLITAGLTFNYLIGIANISLRSDEFDYNIIDQDDLRIDNFTGEYAIAEPAFNSGSGFGIDIGVQYKRMLKNSSSYSPRDPRSGCKKIGYRWKLGASLLDLGYVDYTGVQRSFTNASTYWRNYGNFKPQGISGIDEGLSTQFALDSALSLQLEPDAREFKAGLPAAGSLQFDYNFGHNFYTSFTYMQGFRLMPTNTGMRKALINITPRWEHKWFEAALPLSLHDYYQPQLGLMLRFYSLVIGSDHILALFAPVDTYGMDIYFNLKITLFDNPKCKPRKKRKKKSSKSCPAYDPVRKKPKGVQKHGFKTKSLKDDY